MRQEEDKDFMEMLLTERICMILKRKKLAKEELDALDEAEAAIASLPEEPQRKIRKWMEFSVNQEEEDQRRIYLGGLKDGIWLAGKVYRMGMDLLEE